MANFNCVHCTNCLDIFLLLVYKKYLKHNYPKVAQVEKKKKKTDMKMKKVMDEFKKGKLHSGSKEGPEVKSKEQAVAIGLSEARKAGGKVNKK